MELQPILIPTEDASYVEFIDGILAYTLYLKKRHNNVDNQHLCLVSDVKPKEGDWVLNLLSNEVYKLPTEECGINEKKIEFTTDPKLIAEEVPAIDGNTKAYFIKEGSFNITGFGYKPIRIAVNLLTELCKRWNDKADMVIEVEMEEIKFGKHKGGYGEYFEDRIQIKLTKDGQPTLIFMENKPTNQSAQTQIQGAKLQEFKDIVAKKYGFTDWSDFKESAPTWKQVDEYYIEAFTLAMYKATASSGESGDGEVVANGCEAGCVRYTGGEIRHHKDCKHYPDSLSQKYDQMDALPHPYTKQSVNPPAQEVDVEKLAEKYRKSIEDKFDENEVEIACSGFKAGYNQCLQSKAGSFSLEDARIIFVNGGGAAMQKHLGKDISLEEAFNDTIQFLTSTQSKAGGYSLIINYIIERKNKLDKKADYYDVLYNAYESIIDKIQSLTSTPLQTKGREVEWRIIEPGEDWYDEGYRYIIFESPAQTIRVKTPEEVQKHLQPTNPLNK